MKKRKKQYVITCFKQQDNGYINVLNYICNNRYELNKIYTLLAKDENTLSIETEELK